ncbi:hypothetical protein AAHB53_28110 [Niallia circulans]
MMDSFLTDVLPYMTREEQLELLETHKSKSDQEVETVFNKILLSVSIRQAKERLNENKL